MLGLLLVFSIEFISLMLFLVFAYAFFSTAKKNKGKVIGYLLWLLAHKAGGYPLHLTPQRGTWGVC